MMKSYMLLIGFLGLLTCSFNVTPMGRSNFLSFDFEEENVATSDLPINPEEELAQRIFNLAPELQEVVILQTLDSILKQQLPREKEELNTLISRFLQLIPNPLLSNSAKKYFLNKLFHKLYLTGRYLKVPDWYLIKLFGDPKKVYNRYEKQALRKKVLDYGFSLLERLNHNQFNRKVENGTLNLSRLRLNSLDGLLKIPNINKVKKLILKDNQLTEIPPEIGKLKALQVLYLDRNQLKKIPPEIGELEALQILYLDDNKLTEIPSEIGNLKALTTLSVSNNQLTEIPPEIGNLEETLEELYLYDNKLTEVPSEIGNLKALTTLALNNTQLTETPPLGNLKALKILYLGDNQLTKIPPEIGILTALQILDLSDNPIKALPTQMEKLKDLRTLRLEGNQDLKNQKAEIKKMLPNVQIVF